MIKYIKNLFRKKYTVAILFKSGHVVKHKAYKFSVKSAGNDLTSITHEWVGSGPSYIRLDDISSISCK